MVGTEQRPAHVLLVEDDPGLAAMMSDGLRARHYDVWHVNCGSDAELAVEQLRPDVVVLDLILPDRNGLVLCASLNRRAGVPVIICSATKRKDDAVIGFHLGAADFLPKPFSLDELQARIDLALQRWSGLVRSEPNQKASQASRQQVGGLVIDQTRCRVTVGTQVLQLTPTEYRLLSELAGRPSQVLGRSELAERVWGCADLGVLHSLDVHMRRLRAKLSAAGGPLLVTRRGFGYQLVAEASATPTAAAGRAGDAVETSATPR